MSETLKEKTAKGLFWGAMNNGAMQLIGLAFGIVLGRLLCPADYGMIAMISVFSLVANALQASGFVSALVNLSNPTDNDYNSVFWFNISIGAVIYALLFFAAPWIAAYYNTPELISLSRYAFLCIPLASMCTAQSAYLIKNMMVKQRAKSNVTATLTSSIVGVLMAFAGCSYWALATQTIVYNIINTSLFWHYSHWRPTLHIDFQPARQMFKFSCKILATNIIVIINNNVLNLLLGHYFTAHDTGNYNQASQWNTKAYSMIQGMFDAVSHPVLADLREQPERQLQALRKLIRLCSFVAFPLMFGFGMVSHEFIVITITEKWIESADLLRLLSISGAVMPMTTIFTSLLFSKGRSDIFLYVTLIIGLLQISTMLLLWPWGIHCMVIAYVTISVLGFFVWHYFVSRLINYRLLWFLKDTMPFAMSALVVMVITYMATLSISNNVLLLLARVAMAAVLYYVVMRLAGAAILKECIGFVKRKL